MITMKNFRVLVPEKKDALLGYTGENLSRRLTIAVDDPRPWSYKLDIRNDAGVANIMDMTAGDGVIYVDIERAALQVSGRVQAQVRAIAGDAVKCSNIFSLFIGDSVQAVNYFESLPPSEFEQLETNLTAIKSEAQASARKAKESENNAKAYAEGGTVQNTTYDESGNLAGITATEVTGAKGYQENASGYATRSAQAMTRAAAYAEGGTAPATLIGNVSYPAIDTIGAKGYMDAAQAASESAGSEKDAAEAARASAEAAESGAIAAKNAAEAAVLNGPKIENDTWWVYDAAKQTYVDTGVDASGLAGQPGSDGKNAYQYAQDGGYTGSETEFATKLAAEHLPVPATAAVGQYFKVKNVDENGLVTEVEAVDAPAGGGSDHGHWETVLETTWDVPTVTPTAFDPETGYFTCAADDLAALDAGAEMDCYIRFADDAKSTQIPLSGNERIVWCIVGKIDDTTFCVKNFDLTGQTTIDCSKFFFDQAKCMIVENFNSRKFRLTLDGKFSAPISLYDNYGFFGVNEKTYLSRSVGYQKIASKYGSLVMEKEIISPYTAIGRVVGSAWFVSVNSAYEDKFADITSAFLKKTATSTNEKGCFTDDGLMLKKLHSSSVPWVAKPFYSDMLKIRKGCYVKLERWVE